MLHSLNVKDERQLLMFRQQSLVVGLRKVLNMSKEFKEYVQTQERNTGISQDRHNHSSLRSVPQKSIGFIKLTSFNFCSVWGPSCVQPPVRATPTCFMWRGSPPLTYHPPKSTVRERNEGWYWILGSDRSNGRSLSGAETLNSSMKRQLPASSSQFHHPPIFV